MYPEAKKRKTQKMPICLVALVVILGAAVAGCIGTLWGSLFVFALVIAIFYGTLALGRTSSAENPGGSIHVSKVVSELSEIPKEPSEHF